MLITVPEAVISIQTTTRFMQKEGNSVLRKHKQARSALIHYFFLSTNPYSENSNK